MASLSVSENHPCGIFLKNSSKIAIVLGREPYFTAVTNLLFSNGLVTKPELDSIKSQHNLDDHQRGTRICGYLYEKLDCDETTAKQRLHCICYIFADKDVANEKLRNIAAKMENKIKVAVAGSQSQSHTVLMQTRRGHQVVEEVDAEVDASTSDPRNVEKLCPDINSFDFNTLNFDAERDNVVDHLKDVNVLLVTATETELCAVLGCRNTEKECIIVDAPGSNFYLGWYGDYHVAIVNTGQGDKKTRQKVLKVQKLVNAKYAIAIGICYGMKPKPTLDIGDIIVSEKIKDITLTREEEDGPLYRVDEYKVKGKLLDVFNTKAGIGFKFEKAPGKYANINTGVLVSEPKLVADQTYKDRIMHQISDALGGEMEGNGLMEAAEEGDFHRIVIKAVADWGNKDKALYKKYQKPAAVAAAQYVHACLKKFPLSLKKFQPSLEDNNVAVGNLTEL